MSTHLILANMISVGAAVFTVLSSLSSGREKIYGYQVLQCLTMALASVFFYSFSGVTTFLLCALRNYYAAHDQLTRKRLVILILMIMVLGLIANNRGLLGLLPVVTTLIYSLLSYVVRTDLHIKGNVILNLTLWAIYDFFILDMVSLVVDAGSVLVTGYALIRDRKLQAGVHGD